MATTQLTTRLRAIKKVERPRPPKLSQRHSINDGCIKTMDELVSLIDNVTAHLTNGYHDESLQMNIITMCNTLKPHALQVEAIYKDQLDRAFVAMRNGSQDGRLDLTTRVHLLELIELRAKQWRHNDSMDNYYTQKLSILENSDSLIESGTSMLSTTPTMALSSPQSPPILAIGEVLKNSGKFAKPTRIPGKNYCKDEVVIRNSDSGKVMGIKGRRVHMIEELSETIISFQRGALQTVTDACLTADIFRRVFQGGIKAVGNVSVSPGAKERLVQITGTSEDKIHYAKDLIKDTIQRNASPVRLEQGGGDKSGIGGSSSSLNSSASDESNRLQQQQQQNSRPRSTLHHSLSTNDASIGEYKYTVTVGNQSIKVTGCNLDLVRTAKLVLDGYFSNDPEHANSGVDYFGFEEEPSFGPSTESLLSGPITPPTPVTPLTPLTSNPLTSSLLSSTPNVALGRELSIDSNATSESEETFKPLAESENNTQSKKEILKLTYDFLIDCSKGPYARRPPSDWAHIQKLCPCIVGKAPIRWFEPEAYKAKVAAAGFITLLPANEADDLE